MVVIRWFALALLMTTAVFAADPPVRIIRLLPQTGFAPLFVRFTITIEPHRDNDEWCYVFAEPGLDEPTILHCEQMDGDRSAKFYTREEKNVDAGEYQLQAVVFRGSEILRSTPVPLKVLGRD